MTTSAMTATDALLACAAATTRAELFAARMALIKTGHDVVRDIDRASVLEGDGTAGQHLLAGTGQAHRDSAAIRSARMQTRLLAELARANTTGGTR